MPTKHALLRGHAQGVPPLVCQSHRSNTTRDTDENPFGLQTKEPLITDQFQPIEACSACAGNTHIMFQSPRLQCESTYGRKTVLALRLKCASLLLDFIQTSTPSATWGGSANCDVSDTPLQREARYGRKTVSASRINCALLQANFHQTCNGCAAYRRSVTYDVRVTTLQCEAR
jgi:hypothetical protein